MNKLFGTDGVRGIVNKDLTCELATKIGKSIGMIFENCNRPKVVLGKDTRISCDMLEGALTAGLCSIGVDVISLGVAPTPAVAFLTRKCMANAGVMISASHNPYDFNGIKIFNKDGYKLCDELENKIEKAVYDECYKYFNDNNYVGRLFFKHKLVNDYVKHVIKSVDLSLEGLKVAFDCSNGASFNTAEKIFSSLGCKCHMLFCNPDGKNINENCGSVHLENLSKFVKENNVDLGIAFDGDADRCLAVDENGNFIDGDFLMAICAFYMKTEGKLLNNTVVGTIMTNLGFNRFCESNDINFIQTDVGDRYVLDSMLEGNFSLGGEQSGHIIFKDFATTGDGQLTAAILLSIIKKSGRKLSDLSNLMCKLPQVNVNIKINKNEKKYFSSDLRVINLIKKAQKKLGNQGRIIVRVSGTEPLIRIMVEWENSKEIKTFITDFVAKIKSMFLKNLV
ncbi:MAG: phosphoglucosamine mutase [Oscillospiraceae bacterium]|jgi:phosphoglucosamine mutase|nr:phosphoglucosamine mutase [Oscillospiraceae bacterium]